MGPRSSSPRGLWTGNPSSAFSLVAPTSFHGGMRKENMTKGGEEDDDGNAKVENQDQQ